MADLYDVLGLERDAGPEEIKAAHRQAVKKTHPDAGGDRRQFDRVQLAYNILSDATRRQRYDETGAEQPVDPLALQRAQAMTTVAGKMNELICSPHVDPRHFDLVLGIRELLDAEANAIRGQIAESRAMQERLRQFERRLKRKESADGPDRMRPLISAQIEAQGQRVAGLEDGLGVIAAAKELAAEYVYEQDKREAVPVQNLMYGRPTTNW